MSFLDKIRKKIASFIVPYVSSSANFYQVLGEKKNLEFYTRWVFACSDTIARNLAQVQWKLYRQTGSGVEEVEEHEILSLLYKFNDRFTKFDSIYLSTIYFLLEGKTAWVLMGENKPTEIWIVPPANLRVEKRDSDGYPLQYAYRVNQKSILIPASNVLMLIKPDPVVPIQGKSILSAVRDVVETDNFIIQWNKNMLKRDARPSGHIEVPGNLTEEEAKLLKKVFMDSFAGYENAYNVAVLKNGAKFVSSMLGAKDLEFIRGRELNRDEILAIFGVPKILLGLEGSYNRATAETAQKVFAENVLNPLMTMITEQLNEFFIPRFGSGFWLDFETFVKEDIELKMSEYSQGWNKWLTTNDIRQREGLASLEGGDSIYMTLTEVPMLNQTRKKSISRIIEVKKKSENKLDANLQRKILKRIKARDFKLNQRAEKIAEVAVRKWKNNQEKKVLSVSYKCKHHKEENLPDKKFLIWEKFISVKRKYDDRWREVFAKIFKRQRDIILENLENRKGIVRDVMFDKEKEVKFTIEVISPTYYATMMSAVEEAAEMVGREPIDISKIPGFQKWIKSKSAKVAQQITDTTYDKLVDVLNKGIEEGLGISELGDKVKDVFKDMTETRADLIARTESARAMTAGEALYWEELGVRTCRWYVAGANPCDKCVEFGMQDWDIKDAEYGTIEYSHPNCECMFMPNEIE